MPRWANVWESVLNNGPILVLLALLVFLPVYGPYMVAIEGRLLPVTSRIEFTETTPTPEGGLDVRFRYEKYRDCEYLNTQVRLGEVDLEFDPVRGQRFSTVRPLGFNVSRLWHLNVTSLEGVQMWFVHRCHPFWITVTKVYG